MRRDGDISASSVAMSGTLGEEGAVELSEHPAAITTAAQRANRKRRKGGMTSS
jgi:hypothetical protein